MSYSRVGLELKLKPDTMHFLHQCVLDGTEALKERFKISNLVQGSTEYWHVFN